MVVYRFNAVRSYVREYVLEGLGGVTFNFFSLDLVLSVDSPLKDVLLLEELLLLLHEFLEASIVLAARDGLQTTGFPQ